MSIQRERSPSFRSRQTQVKVSHASRRLPQDFFLPKCISSPPKKRESEPAPHDALQSWYEREDSQGKNQASFRMPQRGKQASRIRLLNQNDQVSPERPIQREGYINQLLQTMQKKQNIIFKMFREDKEEVHPRPKVIQRVPTGSVSKRLFSQERAIKSESKPRRKMLISPEKERIEKQQVVRQARLSMKQLGPRRNSGEGRYPNVSVGFDGLLTFNRFR